MAFEPKKTEIKNALHNECELSTIDSKEDTNFSLPIYKEDEHEKTKSYNLTLQPSVRRKLDDLAEKQNYKSASKFLNELIKNL